MGGMIVGGAVIRPQNGCTKIVGVGDCEVFIDGEARREYQRQWRALRAERERARMVEENRNIKNARDLARRACAERPVGPIRRFARRVVAVYAVGYALAVEAGERLLAVMVNWRLIEPVQPGEI